MKNHHFALYVRHDVVHFTYMHCLLVLDRHDDVPCTDEEIGQKGSAKLGWVPPAGLSSAERTELYRIAAITARPGYRGMYGETTNLWQKPLS